MLQSAKYAISARHAVGDGRFEQLVAIPITIDRRVISLVLLNLVPVGGVLFWDWQTFDLIFLYWMENLVIGAFVLVRMLVRPYGHILDLAFPLFFAPFFALHYGLFCYVHGSFVVSLFGEAEAGFGDARLAGIVIQALASPTVFSALCALASIQLMDWLRHGFQRGFGCENLKDLMTRPYRRIVVLHLAIIGSGFAVAALDEPMVGLLLLVLLKTLSDIWHFSRDKRRTDEATPFVLSPERFAEMEEMLREPVVTVNGRKRHFRSFAALKASREFRFAQAVMRLLGAAEESKAMTIYLNAKIADERQAAGSIEG